MERNSPNARDWRRGHAWRGAPVEEEEEGAMASKTGLCVCFVGLVVVVVVVMVEWAMCVLWV